jgi:putative transposase
LHRSVKRPKLTAADRLFWGWLSELWSDWRTALVIVKPETVIAWHRKASDCSGPGMSAAAIRADPP